MISRIFSVSSLILILTYFWKSVTSSGEILPFAYTFATIHLFLTDSPTFFSKQYQSRSQVDLFFTARPAPSLIAYKPNSIAGSSAMIPSS